MIHITRPLIQTHKTVLNVSDKSLDNNLHKRSTSGEKTNNLNIEEKQYRYNKESLEKAVEDTNRVLFDQNDRFEFKIHERTGRIMVKLIDNETDEIIKEIPPEKILDLVASIWDLVGILVDKRG